jgi:hypothetical protein
MTRKYLAALTALAAIAFVSVITGTGCAATGIGDPCIPEAEYAADFLGFSEQEVNVESKSFQCETRLCLVNHFRGRVSCPYGQNANASAADTEMQQTTPAFPCDGEHGAPNIQNAPCCLPGVDQPVLGDPDTGKTPGASTVTASDVPANCSDRTADKAVYCSCRCANIDGKTDDGVNYCQCPSGFACTQLVTPIGAGNAGLTGAYCIKNNTDYDVAKGSCSNVCDPLAKSGSTGYCGPSNSAQF